MIVREIKENPDEVLDFFDFFNDYDDTFSWAKHNCDQETVDKLQNGFKLWLKWHHESSRARINAENTRKLP